MKKPFFHSVTAIRCNQWGEAAGGACGLGYCLVGRWGPPFIWSRGNEVTVLY
jgi:hypothetical protein